MRIPDQEILILLRSDINRGGQSLFRRYYRPLVFFADSILHSREDSEDLVQDVFYRFISGKIYHSADFHALGPYLFQAVKNLCIDRLRKNREINLESVDFLRISILEEENITFDPEIIESILQAMDELPEQTGRVVRAVILEQKKYKEVAEKLDISLNTVKTLMKNGLSMLRERFSKQLFFFFFSCFLEGVEKK